MAGYCRTCTSEDKAAIEALIVSGRSLSAVGRQFSMDRDALRRHRDRHMSMALTAPSRRAGDRRPDRDDRTRPRRRPRVQVGGARQPNARREARVDAAGRLA